MYLEGPERLATVAVGDAPELDGTPRQRLERLIGPELASMLLAALLPRHTRRGSSSP